MIKAVLYTRVSTDQQDMQRQDFLLPDYCARHDMIVADTFSDFDTSGSIPMAQREGGAQMLAELKRLASENSDVVLVTTDQNRVGRDIIDIVGTIRAIWNLGVMPHFAAEGGALPRTPENEMILGIKASTAQYGRDKIRSNIRMKMSAKRAQNQLCGTVSYGWDAVETGESTVKGVKVRNLVDNPGEQKWIHHMHKRRFVEGWAWNRIARELNQLKVQTKHGRGDFMRLRVDRETVAEKFTAGKWCGGTVKKILESKTVTNWLATRNDAGEAVVQAA